MNAKEFNTKKEAIYKKWNASKTDLTHEVFINTKFGKVYISAEYVPRITTANIHSKVIGDISGFKNDFGYHTSATGKLNSYSSDPEWILDTLDEYLDNLNEIRIQFSYGILKENYPELKNESTILVNDYQETKYALIEKKVVKDGTEKINHIFYSDDLEKLTFMAETYKSWYNYPLNKSKSLSQYVSNIN